MIRRMTQTDADAVAELEAQLFSENPWPKDQFLYELNENPFAKLYVDEENGGIRGYIDFWLIYEQAQIATIGVKKEYQRNGIADALMEQCFADCEKEGCETLSLEVRVSNTPAMTLYEKKGFIRAATRKQYYENGEDAYLMVKPLGGYDDTDSGN